MEKEWQDWKIYMRSVRGDIPTHGKNKNLLQTFFSQFDTKVVIVFALIDWYGSSEALYMFVTAIFDCFPLVKKKSLLFLALLLIEKKNCYKFTTNPTSNISDVAEIHRH